MAIDPREIDLTDEQRRILAELAEKAGKPWEEVYADALGGYSYSPCAKSEKAEGKRTLYDALSEDNAIGCIDGGPRDVSTNPMYMEGFGRGDRQKNPY